MQRIEPGMVKTLEELSDSVDLQRQDLDTMASILVDIDQPISYVSLNKDENGIYTRVEYRRKVSNTLYAVSVLSGGFTPGYTTRTITYYGQDGTTVRSTIEYTLTYDDDGTVIGEV